MVRPISYSRFRGSGLSPGYRTTSDPKGYGHATVERQMMESNRGHSALSNVLQDLHLFLARGFIFIHRNENGYKWLNMVEFS